MKERTNYTEAFRKQALGPEHPNVVTVRENYAALLDAIKQQKQGQVAE